MKIIQEQFVQMLPCHVNRICWSAGTLRSIDNLLCVCFIRYRTSSQNNMADRNIQDEITRLRLKLLKQVSKIFRIERKIVQLAN